MPVAEDRRERRHELRREQILAAAAAEFAEHGYDGATLERIGERIGLSKASLYHYVDSKQELLATLLGHVTTQIQEAAVRPVGTPAVERLRAFVRAHVAAASTIPEGTVLAENLAALLARAPASKLEQVRRHHEEHLARILRDGAATGELRPVAVGPAVKLLFASLNSIPRWFDPDGPLTLDELADQVVDLVLTGLVVR